jgi:hypothetical protein
MRHKLVATTVAVLLCLPIGQALADYVAKDATGTTRYFKSSGTGISGDPYIPEHKVNDGGGAVSVDDNGGSITVDNGGTFAVQAAQSGSWSVTPLPSTHTVTYVTNNSGTSFTAIAGVAGQTIKLYGFVLGVDVADRVTLKCATSPKMALNLGALSGLGMRLPDILTCGVGEALVIDKGLGATQFDGTFWTDQN